jgi:adenosylcobinamide kinase / adenosylcobinamide-phosphate guanylyltransferase
MPPWKGTVLADEQRLESQPAGDPQPRTILILGGARSGKSAHAETLATELGGPVLFVATAEALDDEMAERIRAHQASRPPRWETAEAPIGLAAAIRRAGTRPSTILVDCITLLVSNLVMAEGSSEADMDAGRIEQEVAVEIDGMLDAARDLNANLVVVSNEVGLGLVPEYRIGRLYRDALGRANQRLAAAVDEVYLLVAGTPMIVKAPTPRK